MQQINKLSWIVKRYNCNENKIEDYDVLKWETADIKKLKKAANNKEEFAEELKHHLKYYYWSRCEWELLVNKIDGKIILKPWCGCKHPDDVAIDVTNDASFDWPGFVEKYADRQWNCQEAKIDVWDQIEYRWNEFVDYCWNTRLKYERVK